MSLASDIQSFFQTKWANRLVDTCTVKRVSDSGFSTTSGSYSPTYTTVTTTSCLVRPSAQGDEVAGEAQQELRRYNVFISYQVTDLQPDDLVDITSTNDSYLNGKTFTVRNVRGDTYNHVRRLECEENV